MGQDGTRGEGEDRGGEGEEGLIGKLGKLKVEEEVD